VRKLSVIISSFIAMSMVGLMLFSAAAKTTDAQMSGASEDSTPRAPKQKPHSNHIPKHGGVFFMALDNIHHLEGVLLQSGIFRVYLYDVYTKPLSAAKVKQASGTVQVGESANAPIIPLVVGKDVQTLESALGKDLKLPVTLTVSLHLPGSAPSARPEVFTFPFSHFIAEDTPSRPPASMDHSGHDMNGIKMDH
jgi:hypothetical protein